MRRLRPYPYLSDRCEAKVLDDKECPSFLASPDARTNTAICAHPLEKVKISLWHLICITNTSFLMRYPANIVGIDNNLTSLKMPDR